MKKCCKKYGDEITDMLNRGLFKCANKKTDKKFLISLANFVSKVTGNVNVTQKLYIIAENRLEKKGK